MTSTPSYSVQRLSNAEVPLANKFYRAHGFRGRAKRHEPCAVVRDEGSAIVACGYVRDFNRVQGADTAQGCNSAQGSSRVQDCNGFKLLAGVAVDPAHQGNGVARLLLQRLSQAFDSHTYTFPYAHLLPFYSSLGFQPCEARFEEVRVDEVADHSKSGLPSLVYDLYQRYRDQGREIAMMVYVDSSP